MEKLEGLRERYAEVGALLAEPEVATDPSRLRSLAKEHAELSPIVECFVQYHTTMDSIEEAREILASPDPDMRVLAQEEIDSAEGRRTSLESELKVLQLPADPADSGNVYLERFGPAPAETRPPCSPAICSECTCAMESSGAGSPKS